MVSPIHFRETSAINSRQMFEYERAPIDRDMLLHEHNSMVAALRDFGATVREVVPNPLLPYALNVRDTFVIAGRVVVASAMGRAARLPEPYWTAPQLGLELEAMFLRSGRLEGGDVLVLETECLVGISERTDATGAGALASATGMKVAPVLLAPNVLHLDTALNVMGDVAVIAPGLLSDPDSVLDRLSANGVTTIVELSADQAWNLESNFLALDPATVLIAESSSFVIDELRSRGIHTISISMAEHHRIGGSVRCATLPLEREFLS